MKSFKKLLLILLFLVPAVCAYPAAAQAEGVLEDKALYRNHPLYIDLNTDPSDAADDKNFVVMQEGAVILDDPDLRLEPADDGKTYTLYGSGGSAMGITPGTPVAFIDIARQQMNFFLPQQVTVGADRVVFSCDPESVTPEQLFWKIALDIEKDISFSQDIDFTDGTMTFKGKLSGDLHIDVFCNGLEIETANWLEYDLTNVLFEADGNLQQEFPIAKVPITGVPYIGLEIGIGLGVFAEGDTEVEFDITEGKAGFKLSERLLPLPGTPSFENQSSRPNAQIREVIAEGDFELGITLGPSLDVLGIIGMGCDLATDIEVNAELTGDEGGAQSGGPEKWHICKELSCLQGEIDVLAKAEAWLQVAKSAYSISYDLLRQNCGDFHYSFTFDEFAFAPCDHYLYLVDIGVFERGTTNPMKDVTVEYAPLLDLSDRKGEDYIRGKTDENGYIGLYMPGDTVKITATSWQDDPAPAGKIHATVEYAVKTSGEPLANQVRIELPPYSDMHLVNFDENAHGEPVENMPSSFSIEQGTTGYLPNEVPRREGYAFVGWSDPDDPNLVYLPGGPITPNEDIELDAIWDTNPVVPSFRTIIYDPDGGILADNPQIYESTDSFVLINPTRKDHIFTGWTGSNGDEPQLHVTVECESEADFVNRVYKANWTPVHHNVIWRNWDGTWLDVTRDVAAGTDPEGLYDGPTPPVRASDEQFFYIFSH